MNLSEKLENFKQVSMSIVKFKFFSCNGSIVNEENCLNGGTRALRRVLHLE